jgi:hypothetical protein
VSGGEAEAIGRAFAVWARAALGRWPGIAEGRAGQIQVTGEAALLLMRAAHRAGWLAGAEHYRRANGGGRS